jgi:hypothetical protein
MDFSEIMLLFLEIIESLKFNLRKEKDDIRYTQEETRSPIFPHGIVEEEEDNTLLSKPFTTNDIPTDICDNNKQNKKLINNNIKDLLRKESLDVQFQKEKRLENNLIFLKTMNFIKNETPTNNKLSEENLVFGSSDSKNNVVINTESYLAKSHVNANISRPVSKIGKMKTLNLLYNKLQKEGFIANTNNTQLNFVTNTVNNQGSICENDDNAKLIQRQKTLSKKLRLSMFMPDSFTSTARPSFKESSLGLDFDIRLVMKEIKTYKITIENLSNELLYLRNNNFQLEKTIENYQENEKKVLESEIENFSNTLKLYKSLYEDELKNNRNIIENLVKIIDEMQLKYFINNFSA